MEDDTVESESATPRFPFDSVYKALCCHRRTIRDMLHGYLLEQHGPLRRELIAALDLDTLRRAFSRGARGACPSQEKAVHGVGDARLPPAPGGPGLAGRLH